MIVQRKIKVQTLAYKLIKRQNWSILLEASKLEVLQIQFISYINIIKAVLRDNWLHI